MRDQLIASIRTTMQGLVTAGLAWLSAWLLSRFGIDVDLSGVVPAVVAIAIGFVTFALNWLQKKVPLIGRILSLGLSSSTPSY